MEREPLFRRILPNRRRKTRSIPWLAGMILVIIWLIMYLNRLSTA